MLFRVHTNPTTHVGAITDWMDRGSQQNSLCIFNPLGHREGVLTWALVSVSQWGSMALAPTSILG